MANRVVIRPSGHEISVESGESVLDAALLARVGDDDELAEQLLRQIHGDLPRRLEAVRAAVLAGEVDAAHQACHPLKGALL
ncbi:MAG: hypothetical protein ACOCP9_04695, partial [Halofilum sp. (in: g-proteobacteria)]